MGKSLIIIALAFNNHLISGGLFESSAVLIDFKRNAGIFGNIEFVLDWYHQYQPGRAKKPVVLTDVESLQNSRYKTLTYPRR